MEGTQKLVRHNEIEDDNIAYLNRYCVRTV